MSDRSKQASSSAKSSQPPAINTTLKSTRNQPKYQEGEKILCYHGAFIYEAKCLKVEKSSANEYSYFVHYAGWNKNWDEWVNFKRILKYNDENLKKQQDLIAATKQSSSAVTSKSNSSNSSSSSGKAVNQSQSKKDESAQAASTATNLQSKKEANSTNLNTNQSQANLQKKRKTVNANPTSTTLTSNNNTIIQKNEVNSAQFNALASDSSVSNDKIGEPVNKKICVVDISSKNCKVLLNSKFIVNIPESLKEWLVDDFDFVIQQNKLVRLPCKKTVSQILRDYLKTKQKLLNNKNDDEEPIASNYLPHSNETINNLIKLFNSMLGSQLLYKFERIQYTEILKNKKPMADIYGAMHLLRLLERINQMILYAPLEEDSLEVLIYYVNDILKYLDRENKVLFDSCDYILAPPYYVRSSI